MQEGLLIVISGPSGVGKNTIINNLFKKLPDLSYSISATTRSPRPNEVDGQHYFFLTEADFLQKIDNSEFLEWAKVYQYYYGTPKETVFESLKSGKNVVLDVDVQGALQIRKSYPKAILIFLAPPSVKELKNRLIGRHTEPEEQVAERLKYITKEFQCAPEYDYLVINRQIDLTCSQIECIIHAEKCRISRLEKGCLETILNDQ